MMSDFFYAGSFYDDVSFARHVVWYIASPSGAWLLLWISQTGVQKPSSNKPNSSTGATSTVVYASSCQVCNFNF